MSSRIGPSQRSVNATVFSSHHKTRAGYWGKTLRYAGSQDGSIVGVESCDSRSQEVMW